MIREKSIEIADHVGCSVGYVNKVQKELFTSEKLTPPEKRKGKDGKSRPTTYKTKPKVQPEPEPELESGPELEKPRVHAADEIRAEQEGAEPPEEADPASLKRSRDFERLQSLWLSANRATRTRFKEWLANQ